MGVRVKCISFVEDRTSVSECSSRVFVAVQRYGTSYRLAHDGDLRVVWDRQFAHPKTELC